MNTPAPNAGASPEPASMSGASDAAFVAALGQLRAMAQALLAKERAGHTLQATALVNEAFLRLRAVDPAVAADPQHFLRASAVAMRHVLIDHARGRNRAKRGEGALPKSLDSVELATSGQIEQVLAVDDAIEIMARDAPQFAELVRLRFYAGLDVASAARVLGKSERTIEREWTYARARLFRLLGGADEGA